MKSPEDSESEVTELELLPRQFGRLILLRQLARGGMGEVFLATSGGIEGAERPCVVKIIRKEHKDDESFLARFLDEARIQAQLAHPGVAQVLEATRGDDGEPYVIVEYIEGRNLGEVRARALQLGVRLAWPEAVALAISMGDALAHVHERTDAAGRPLAIVHRDLSPQNVMISYGGDTKLIDFGTARGENRRCHTVAGVVFAKPGYVAPEVANQTPGAVPADLYAFGIMLWELVANRRFLSGEASSHLAQVALGKRNPVPLAQLTGAPIELDAIIAKLTAPNIDVRYSAARQATFDLVEVLKQAPSLANGDRSVRGRISQLMQRLYPAEPARSRAEFARLVAEARHVEPRPTTLPEPSPEPQASEASEPSDLLAGTRFRLVREIGRGGMGVVYEALHIDLARSVAVKVLPLEHSQNEARTEQFRIEARALAGLHHENLVKLHDFGVARDGRLFYAMELLEGESLESHLEHHKGMDWREAVQVGIQACRALEVAHEAGVIHRDIKPANLFMTRDNVTKLLDFGIAKMKDSTQTETGDAASLSILGTPEYLAPEQATHRAADERSDLYALGAVLYELVTGRLPHVAETTVGLLDAKINSVPESPRQRAPQRGLPPMLDKVIMRSLKTDPSARFQNAAEMREALEAALREPELQRNRRRRAGLVALGALMSAMVAGAVTVGNDPELAGRVSAKVSPMLNYVRELRQGKAAAPARAVSEQADGLAKAAPQPAKAAPAALETDDAQPGDSDLAMAEDTDETGEADVDIDLDAPDALAPAAATESGELAQAGEAELGAGDGDSDGSAAEPSSDTESDTANADLEALLVQAEQQMTEGNRLKGFNTIKRLAWKHPKDARALRAYSEAAVSMKAWGEAYRAAYNWAEVDPSPDAKLQLAKLERATSRGNYKSTLKKLLAQHPDHAEATALLGGASNKALAQRDE
ncbi:MAG TPA: serine/threonine-protein kinase [Polyangiaceae bacterium]